MTTAVRRRFALVACWVILAAMTLATNARAQSTGIDAEAQRILKASTDFVAKQQRFTVDTRSTLEIVLPSGQKIEFNGAAHESVQRPDKLRAERTGDLVRQEFVYDGNSLTQHNPDDRLYAQVPAPATLEGMLDFARDQLGIFAPAGDLIHKDAYDILMDGAFEGYVVGKSVIDGVRCDHLAFRAAQVDWQIWIEEGARPLPRRLLITTLDLPNAPQFSVTVTHWDLQPKFDARTFVFAPPVGTTRIEFLTH